MMDREAWWWLFTMGQCCTSLPAGAAPLPAGPKQEKEKEEEAKQEEKQEKKVSLLLRSLPSPTASGLC